MENYARWDFNLSKTDKDGITRRAHLKQVQKTYEKKGVDYVVPELVPPEFPELLDKPWKTFLRLNTTRGVSEVGAHALSFVEIKAWCDLMQETLRPFEVEVIKRIDDIYLRVANG